MEGLDGTQILPTHDMHFSHGQGPEASSGKLAY